VYTNVIDKKWLAEKVKIEGCTKKSSYTQMLATTKKCQENPNA
jgi:hypothetical protein